MIPNETDKYERFKVTVFQYIWTQEGLVKMSTTKDRKKIRRNLEPFLVLANLKKGHQVRVSVGGAVETRVSKEDVFRALEWTDAAGDRSTEVQCNLPYAQMQDAYTFSISEHDLRMTVGEAKSFLLVSNTLGVDLTQRWFPRNTLKELRKAAIPRNVAQKTLGTTSPPDGSRITDATKEIAAAYSTQLGKDLYLAGQMYQSIKSLRRLKDPTAKHEKELCGLTTKSLRWYALAGLVYLSWSKSLGIDQKNLALHLAGDDAKLAKALESKISRYRTVWKFVEAYPGAILSTLSMTAIAENHKAFGGYIDQLNADEKALWTLESHFGTTRRYGSISYWLTLGHLPATKKQQVRANQQSGTTKVTKKATKKRSRRSTADVEASNNKTLSAKKRATAASRPDAVANVAIANDQIPVPTQ